MSEQTKIEWCDSTFNPWIGCTRVSPACDHCYAAVSTPARTLGVEWGAHAERRRTSDANWKQPLRWEREHEAFAEQHGRRRRVFCASLADVFDNEVPTAWRAELFALIAGTPHLDWLLLTKRIGNVAKMIEAPGMQKCGLPPNVWLGITVCNQPEADRDIPKLLELDARVRFISIEPMLGPIDVRKFMWPVHPVWPAKYRSPQEAIEAGAEVRYKRQALVSKAWADRMLSWVIAGGESGPQARPMHPDWARSLRDQCAAAGVPFLFKQWGEWVPRGPESMGYPLVDGVLRVRLTDRGENGQSLSAKGGNDCWMQRAGKKAAGRMLDGVVHDAWPANAAKEG